MKKDKEKRFFRANRVFANIFILFLIMLTPWWVYLSVALIFLFYFDYYYEVVFLGLFIDALYGTPIILVFPLFFTFTSLFLFLAWTAFKGRLYY